MNTSINFIACEQNCERAPKEVKTAFDKKFADVEKVKWEKESDTEWEAKFKMNGIEYSACFGADGSWIETEYEIQISAIPDTVRSILDVEFAGFEIDGAEMIENTDGIFYEIELEKGDVEIEVLMDSFGAILEKEVITKDDDDNDDEDDDDDDAHGHDHDGEHHHDH